MAYVTVDEAEVYFANRLYSEAWVGATEQQKSASLAMATRRIDALRYRGARPANQATQFPRVGQATVPQEVKDACCEEALALLKYGGSKRHQLQDQGVKSFSAGKISETFSETRRAVCTEAHLLLAKWFAKVVSIEP